MIALSIFFATNVNIYCQTWNNDCDYNSCYDSNNIPWETKTVKVPYNGTDSPNCWVEITYRIRSNDGSCPGLTGCELDILLVMTAGECFYPHQDPYPPNTTYPPLMDINSVQDMWNKSIEIFLESNIEPCFVPTGSGPNGCVYVSRLNSATCKKMIDNGDCTKSIEYCESYNSCCGVDVIICQNPGGSNAASWHLPNEVPDNCFMNNDSECKLSCESHNWIAPKIIFNKSEIKNIVEFNNLTNGLEISSGNLIVDYEVINVLGNKVLTGRITGLNLIDNSKLSTGMYILILKYNGQRDTFNFIIQK